MTEIPTIKFPHPTLTPIKGKPNAETLQQLRKEIKANAKAIYSTRGGAKHGHLYIILSKTAYAKQVGQTYNVPTHPGEAPEPDKDCSILEVMELNRKYNAMVQEFQTYQQVKNEIKQHLIDAIEPTYLAILEDPEEGFADVEPLDILDHLQDAYGIITEQDIENNRNKLLEPWDPHTPIEELWTKIARVTQFAKLAKNPLLRTEVQHLTIQMFKKQGIFEEFIRDWNYKIDKDNKAWSQFQEHFTRAAKHFRETTTTKQAGYEGAAYKANELAGEIKKVLADLNIDTNNNTSTTSRQDQCIEVDQCVKMSYCWTHGMLFGTRHNSKTCQNRNPNHDETATIKNMKGGSRNIQTYRPPSERRSPRND